jgi:hypothetical protein
MQHLVEALTHPGNKIDCLLYVECIFSPQLTFIDSLNRTGTEACIAPLARALTHDHCKLTQVMYSGIGLTIEGAMPLLEAIKHKNCTLTWLE